MIRIKQANPTTRAIKAKGAYRTTMPTRVISVSFIGLDVSVDK
jgi:hypothetical protein